MHPRCSAAALALAASALLLPVAAEAQCRTAAAGALCISLAAPPPRPQLSVESVALTSASAATPEVGVGDVLARGEYSIILNAEYYGLPPVSDGWVYMRIGQDAYRVDWRSHEVLERVTDRVAANF